MGKESGIFHPHFGDKSLLLRQPVCEVCQPWNPYNPPSPFKMLTTKNVAFIGDSLINEIYATITCMSQEIGISMNSFRLELTRKDHIWIDSNTSFKVDADLN